MSTSTGEQLENDVGRSALVERHAELADGLLPWVIGLLVVAVMLWVRDRRDQGRSAPGTADGPGPGVADALLKPVVIGVLAVVAVLGTTQQVVHRPLRGRGRLALRRAPDGQAGLHRALTAPYDVMVLDRGLPAIEGLDLLGRLRRKGVRTPVLVLTAYDTVGNRVAGLDAGAQDHLGKPFDVDELLARLRALLRRDDPGATTELVDLGLRRLDVGARVQPATRSACGAATFIRVVSHVS